MSEKKIDMTLILGGDDIDSETLYRYKIDLRRMLEENIEDGQIQEPANDLKAGAKGDPITIGTIILSLISSGALTSLVKSFKGIFARDRHLRITVKNGGQEINVDAKNINDDRTIKLLERLFK